MATYSALPVSEEFYEQEETHSSENAGTRQVVISCSWSSRYAVIDDILINRREWPHGTHTVRPRANSISMVPMSSCESTVIVGQAPTYDRALLTVNYSGDTEEDLLAEALEPTVDFVTLDYRKFRWYDADAVANFGNVLLEGEAPTKQILGGVLVRQLFQVPGPLPSELLTLMDTVNSTTYTSALLGLTFPPETLLYTPPFLTRTITTAGIGAWDITLRFKFRQYGWNTFWRGDTEEWARIGAINQDDLEADLTIYNNFPLANYSSLLF